MEIALFQNGIFKDEFYAIEIKDRAIRSGSNYVYLTLPEYKIARSLVDSGYDGYSLYDIPQIICKDSNYRSICIVRTHISNIKRKLSIIGRGRIEVTLELPTMRYYITRGLSPAT